MSDSEQRQVGQQDKQGMLGQWAGWPTVASSGGANPWTRGCVQLSSGVPLLKRQQQPVLPLAEFYHLPQKLPPTSSFFSCVIYQSLCILFENQKQDLNPSVPLQNSLQISLHFSKGNCKTPHAAWQLPVFCSMQPYGLGLCPRALTLALPCPASDRGKNGRERIHPHAGLAGMQGVVGH